MESQLAPGSYPICKGIDGFFRATGWLREAQVTRPDSSGPLPDQSVDTSDIERLATGAIGLLKGEAWEGNEGRGLVHRSPAPGDHPRLVLALDWL
ncbi:DUF1826 domain-containing protein [Marinobacter sp. HN1S83]|uniref:DUF1826 domain-containing protein n=1 Tax=Marinobacter sp. HN1S83 TaxID=3382301 RepID=UPI00387AB3AF